ncbi:hypothetical protein [Chroococcidiopsis sp. CCMEE 29]|uniref:hypothetical protein n=1 Tax=Chroococcidiopsis sp. CCMEE 29 TaxID=155894 RepID=UPI002020DA70|nr:hypothetical protein [Chroococcidiopsis sp. CCMEE 29]
MAIALILPFMLVGANFSMVPLPARYFPWPIVILIGYFLVQRIKIGYIKQFQKWL